MKPCHVILLATVGVFAAIGGQRATAGGNGIPTGHFANTTVATLAVCLNPTTFVLESCSSKGALVYPISFTAVGSENRDTKGACVARTNLSSPLPPSTSPPIVDSKAHEVVIVTDYDPTTGVGDATFTNYDGGRCIGANFDSTGATLTGGGIEHFVVSQEGTRIDGTTTSLTDPTNSYGSFLINSVDLKQQ
jgi:hypothetical protein